MTSESRAREREVLTPLDEAWPEWADGYLFARKLGNDDWLVIMELIYGYRLAQATPYGPIRNWDYDTLGKAYYSLEEWPYVDQNWTRRWDGERLIWKD